MPYLENENFVTWRKLAFAGFIIKKNLIKRENPEKFE